MGHQQVALGDVRRAVAQRRDAERERSHLGQAVFVGHQVVAARWQVHPRPRVAPGQGQTVLEVLERQSHGWTSSPDVVGRLRRPRRAWAGADPRRLRAAGTRDRLHGRRVVVWISRWRHVAEQIVELSRASRASTTGPSMATTRASAAATRGAGGSATGRPRSPRRASVPGASSVPGAASALGGGGDRFDDRFGCPTIGRRRRLASTTTHLGRLRCLGAPRCPRAASARPRRHGLAFTALTFTALTFAACDLTGAFDGLDLDRLGHLFGLGRLHGLGPLAWAP